MFWGIPSQHGSLSSLRCIIHRVQVDEKVKVFNIGDEFVMHTFQAHLTTAIMDYFNTSNPSDTIAHPCNFDWLQQQAQTLVHKLLSPSSSSDPIQQMHKSFLHVAYSYVDLRHAIYQMGKWAPNHTPMEVVVTTLSSNRLYQLCI